MAKGVELRDVLPPATTIARCRLRGSADGGWRRADHVNDLAAKAYGTIVASLLNRYLHLVPKGAEGSIELLKPSCMVQTKQPINQLALPVQASHKLARVTFSRVRSR